MGLLYLKAIPLNWTGLCKGLKKYIGAVRDWVIDVYGLWIG